MFEVDDEDEMDGDYQERLAVIQVDENLIQKFICSEKERNLKKSIWDVQNVEWIGENKEKKRKKKEARKEILKQKDSVILDCKNEESSSEYRDLMRSDSDEDESPEMITV